MRSTVAVYRNHFDTLVIESVHEALTDLLGESARQAVYDALEKNHPIARNQIPERLDDFPLALERTFGMTCGKTIGKVIVKRLYSKLGLVSAEKTNWRLPDYVREAKMKHCIRSEKDLLEQDCT